MNLTLNFKTMNLLKKIKTEHLQTLVTKHDEFPLTVKEIYTSLQKDWWIDLTVFEAGKLIEFVAPGTHTEDVDSLFEKEL